MALPTYQKQVRQAGQVRQTAGGTSTEGFMASARASESLAQRLSSFSNQMSGIAKGMAQSEASSAAVRDIHDRKQKIADINASYDNRPLTLEEEEQRVEEIKSITEGTRRQFSGVYSRAYESASAAAYSNQITVDTAEASNQAMIAAEGNSDAYIAQMNVFREETVANAPSVETGIVAELAINQYGGRGYKSLKLEEIRRDEIKRHQYYNSTIDLQTEDTMANMQEGDWVNGSENLFKMEQTLMNGMSNGWTNDKEAELIMMKATENGILAYAKDRIAMLEPVEAQKFIDDFRSGSYEKEIPTEFYSVDAPKLAERMEYLLEKEIRIRDTRQKASDKQDYEDVKDVIYLLDQGEEVDANVLESAYYKNIKPETRKDLEQAMNDNGFMKYFDTQDLTKQSELIGDLRDKTDKTADDLRLQKKYEKHFMKAQKQIDNDPLVYSQGKAFDEELEPLNLQDKDVMLKAEDRLEKVMLAKEYTDRRVGLFTKQEAATVKSQLDGMTAGEKIDVMDKINTLPSDVRDDTYNQLGGTFAFAGGLTSSGNEEAARLSLLGKNADVALPEAFKINLGAKIANAFGGYDGELYTQNIKGLTDYAKGIILNGGDASDVDQLITDSVGKMVKYNSKTTIIPYGVKKKNFESWLDNIVIDGRPGLTKGLQNMTDVLGSGDYQLHHAGQGKYYVKVNNDGNPYFAKSSEDDTKPFVLDWNAK